MDKKMMTSTILKNTDCDTEVDFLPRGLRNNNPLNIKKGEHWKGLRMSPTDKRFCEFKTMAFGFRAAHRIMMTYWQQHGCRTLVDIIGRWAPPGENNTWAYTDYVSRKVGYWRTLPLPDPHDSQNVALWASILTTMATYENGIDCRKYTKAARRGIQEAMGL